MSRKKIILFLLAAFGGLLVLAAVHFVRPIIDTFKAELSATVSGALGMEARLGQVGLSPASGEVTVKGLTARKDGVEALAVKELRVKLDLARLLRHETRITRLVLVAPVVSLARHKDGSFNFAGGRPSYVKAVAISRLVVQQGRFVYTDEGSGRRVEAEGLDLDLNDFSYGGRRGDGPLKKIFFAGLIKCAALKTRGLSAAGLSLRVNAARGVFKAEPFSFTAAGLTGGGSLLADLGAPMPFYRLSYVSGPFLAQELLPAVYHGDSIWKNLRGSGILRADLAAGGNDADELKRTLNGTLRFDGTNLELPSDKGKQPLLTAGSARVTADASVLAQGGNRLELVSLLKPVLFLQRQGGPAPERKRAAGSGSEEKPFLIDLISAKGGSFVYAGEKGGKIVDSGNIDVALKGFSYGGRGGTAARISFACGEVKCSRLVLDGTVSTGVVMGVTAFKGKFNVSTLSMNIFRGHASGRLKADLAASPPGYALVYSLRRFRLGEFLAAFSQDKAGHGEIKGLADLEAEVTARGNSMPELGRTLAGRVALRGKRMLLPNLDVDEVITKYVRSQNFNLLDVGAFLLAGPLGPAVTKSYNFADAGLSRGKNGVVLGLSSAWSFKDGTARAEDVALATARYRIAMQGGLDLADGHFDGVTVAVLDKKGCAAYTQKVKGTFSHPEIGKITMLTTLAGPVLGVLETVQKLNPFRQCEVFYSGSVPQPE